MLKRKPRIIVSKCLGFESCRYSNTICKSKYVNIFKENMELIPVCPEQEIGLPTPRESLRIVRNTCNRLIQPKTSTDYTDAMLEFSDEFLRNFKKIDGFVLKGRSPSCGIKDVKVYKDDGNTERKKTSGIFAKVCMDKHPKLPIEDEGRLTNYNIRDLFLTKLYTTSEFNDLKKNRNYRELKYFHKHHQLLFNLYNQEASKEMNLLLNKEHTDLFDDYERQLHRVFKKRYGKNEFIKTVELLIGLMQSGLSSEELVFLREVIDDFDKDLASEQLLEHLIMNNLLRFKMDHVYNQSLFHKYPKALYTPSNSGK